MSKRAVFLCRYGNSEHIHKAIDSGEIFGGPQQAAGLRNNPCYTREHADKLLNSSDPRHVALAVEAGSHMTSEDFTKAAAHPDWKVQNAVTKHSWNPEDFTTIAKSDYWKQDVRAQILMDRLDRRGIFNRDHYKIFNASKHEKVHTMAWSLGAKYKVD